MFLINSQSFISVLGVTKKRRGPNVDLLFRKSDSGTMANQNKENQTPDTGASPVHGVFLRDSEIH